MIQAVNTATHPYGADRAGRDPADRQAAIFGIGQSLKTLEMREWSWTVMDWLRLYDGFEQYLPRHDDPVLSVERSFASVIRRRGNERISPGKVLTEIEQQPFMFWHAQWLDARGNPVGAAWKPLGEPSIPFWEFSSNKPAGAVELRTQRLETMHIESQAFRSWLMAGWLRFVSPRINATP